MARLPTDNIADILRDECLVLIEGGHTIGSGFFAAPGFVLSNAHVTGAEVGHKVSISWQHHRVTGTVRWASPPPPANARTWPYPDLSVVELDKGAPQHTCALLEQSEPPGSSDLLAIGHSVIYQGVPEANPALVRYGGKTGHPPEQFFVLNGNELPEGMSGGPVLALATGAVCAITKIQRLKNTTMGGRAVPLRALRGIDASLYRCIWRAHDRYHATGSRWLELIDSMRLPLTSGLDHREERQLRGLLAELPSSDDHGGRWRSVAGLLPLDPQTPLIDYRDVAEELGQLYRQNERSLPLAVAYAADLARDGAGAHADALSDWALAVSRRRGQAGATTARLAAAPAAPQIVSLMAELTPTSPQRKRVRLSVWQHLSSGDSVQVYLGPTSLRPESAWRKLKDLLVAELRVAGRSQDAVRIEIFAPVELMDEHVGGWRLWPEHQWTELGRDYPVVLRNVDRRYDGRIEGRWQARWNSLAGAPVGGAVKPIVCEQRTHEAHSGRIEADPQLGALALAASPFESPTRTALEVALAAGVPVVLWQRRACRHCVAPDNAACPGADFVRDIAQQLAQTPLDELPERVRTLRNNALDPDNPVKCGKDLVLLWDDPYRQPPPMKRPASR
ncbi:hypothetical protein GCM10009827_117060 [Dactylosporangium maewongense]|uniref:vWA-MoxR associated protein C-terminal domain-containing protein n=1 Tax=Dactylosporangium maewongense TaxID=634393 RepID=A0ABN2DE69_9ACTN